MKQNRMVATLVLLFVVLSGILFVPLPSSVLCYFALQPHAATSVYIEVEGRLEEIAVKPGQPVQAGDLLARLSNVDLEISIAQLRGQRNALQAQLRSLRQIRFHEEEASLRISVVEEQLEAIGQQLKQQLEDAKRLTLIAPVAGTIIAPPPLREQQADQRIELANWSGTPLQEKNLGATLLPDGEQNLFCKINDPNQWDAVLVINQRDLDLVTEGQLVWLLFEQSPYHVFESIIQYVATDEMASAPSRLASTSGGPLPSQVGPDGVTRPLATSYQAVVRLDNSLGLLRNGLTGQARIKTKYRTLASRIGRYLSRTFNFDL